MNTYMKKTYLITGGQGFIGKAISLSLLDQGNKVIIFDNNFRKDWWVGTKSHTHIFFGSIEQSVINLVACVPSGSHIIK